MSTEENLATTLNHEDKVEVDGNNLFVVSPSTEETHEIRT